MKNIFLAIFIASLFIIGHVPTTTQAASPYWKALSLVQQAEKAASLLKQETSLEYRYKKYPKDPISLPRMDLYNDVKVKLAKAKQEVNKLPKNQRNALSLQLNNKVTVHYSRAQVYIDAINSGTKVITQTNRYNNLFKQNPVSDETEKAFHALSHGIKKHTTITSRVYGKPTRDAILAKYKAPGEKELNNTRLFISLKMEIDKLEVLNLGEIDNETIAKKVSKISSSIQTISDDRLRSKLARHFEEAFQWEVDHPIKKAVKDVEEPVIYGLDDRQNVIKYNYLTREKRILKMNLKPRKMFVFGNELYVALEVKPHDHYWFSGQEGAVAVIDTKTWKLKKQFNVDIDPYDIVADENYIYIVSGSGQWGPVKRYSKGNYQKTGEQSYIYEKSAIAISPDLNRIYSMDYTGIIPNDLRVFRYLDDFDQLKQSNSPYHGDYKLTNDIALSPDGKYIFNGSGNVFLASNFAEKDMTFVKQIPSPSSRYAYLSIDINVEQNKFYTGPYGLRVYDYNQFSHIKTYTPMMSTDHVFYSNQHLIVTGLKPLDKQNTRRKTVIAVYRTDENGMPITYVGENDRIWWWD